jgi:hypothetical protein
MQKLSLSHQHLLEMYSNCCLNAANSLTIELWHTLSELKQHNERLRQFIDVNNSLVLELHTWLLNTPPQYGSSVTDPTTDALTKRQNTDETGNSTFTADIFLTNPRLLTEQKLKVYVKYCTYNMKYYSHFHTSRLEAEEQVYRRLNALLSAGFLTAPKDPNKMAN